MPNPNIAQEASKGGLALRGHPQSKEHIEKRIAAQLATLAKTRRVCRECSSEFTPTSASQAYCSGQCWNRVAARRRDRRTGRGRAVGPREYATLLARYGDRCGICGGVNRSGHRLAVDHEHATDAIRGLLCHRCNTAIGLLQDSPALLAAAIEYLGAGAPTTQARQRP